MLEKDGTLVANQVFRRDLATEYVIQIQVESNVNKLFTMTAITKNNYSLFTLDRWKLSLYIISEKGTFVGLRLW